MIYHGLAMRNRKWLARLTACLAAALSGGATIGYAKNAPPTPGIQESGYSQVFPLQQGGEQIDLLVRVRDDRRRHHLNLLFVERRDWPEEKKRHLRRIFDGFTAAEPERTPYPVKLRVRIDSMDSANNVHVDQIVTERSQLYMRYAENDTVILRAQRIYAGALKNGIYRVRIHNLEPVPQLDFETRFAFERDNRKY